jgi:hypothetical protein
VVFARFPEDLAWTGAALADVAVLWLVFFGGTVVVWAGLATGTRQLIARIAANRKIKSPVKK